MINTETPQLLTTRDKQTIGKHVLASDHSQAETTETATIMGCTSSTEIVTDPRTGEKKTKNKLGGAYPGNRRQGNNPYTPPASQFSNGQATAHFVNYGGGNALVLKQDNGMAQPQVGAIPVKQAEYIQVTLPSGVYGGQTIQVAAPDGRRNEIVVPDGFGPGMTFTVEFVDGPPPSTKYSKYEEQPAYGETTTAAYSNMTPYVPYVTPSSGTATAPTNYYSSPATNPVPATSTGRTQDDGFASGFNNPNFVPHAGDAKPVLY
jgi:hypothetical protein